MSVTEVGFEPRTLVDVLRLRAQLHPDETAYVYLADGEEPRARLTFDQLDRQARALGARLQGLGGAGECVPLLYPPGLEFIAAFFGCMYAGCIAVPLPLPRGGGSLTQLSDIVEDTSTRIVLTTNAALGRIQRALNGGVEKSVTHSLIWLPSDDTNPDIAQGLRSQAVDPEAIAYLQYTSGSTSNRKGVMVSHANVIENLRSIERSFQHTPDSVYVSWLPHFHDLGLVGGILQPLFHGCLDVLLSPTAFVQRPVRWLRAISSYRGTHTNSPNYGYDLCVRRTNSTQREGLDSSSLTVALNGAEPIRHTTLDDFSTQFAACGFKPEAFMPAYGLAEATLVVSSGAKGEEPITRSLDAASLELDRVVPASPGVEQHTLVGCGRVLSDTQVLIVEPGSDKVCGSDQIGEICVAGPAVAKGYWKREDDTHETFVAGLDTHTNQVFLRTGDLGFVADEELFVTGRIKDLIIIRGANHYPQDLEWTTERAHPSLRPGCGAAFAIEHDGEERVVIVQELERDFLRDPDTENIGQAIVGAIAEQHEIQVIGVGLLKTGRVPRTSSGKIQRGLCRKRYLENTLDMVGMYLPLRPRQPSEPTNEQETDETMSPPVSADSLIQWLRRYAGQRLNSHLMDERRSIAPHVVLDFGNQGMFGLQTPVELGGIGLGEVDTLRVLMQLGAIDQTLAMMVIVHNTLGIRPILRYATPTTRRRLVPRLASGRELVAFALTEPQAGSNPQSIVSTATPTGREGGWRLDGHKSWSGTAGWASVLNVFVQNLDASGTPAGTSGFVVSRDTHGVRIGDESLTMGMRAMVQNSIHLEDAPVASEDCLGVPGDGMQVARDAMMHGRLHIGATCVGGMKRCLQLMLRYAGRRSISTGRLIENPVLLERMGAINAACAAIEALVIYLAERLDQSKEVPVEAYVVCKTAGPEWLWYAADSLMQCLGGRGYIETNVAPQLLRDARVTRILEGPTEALQMFLGSRLANNPESLLEFIAQELGGRGIAERLATGAEEIMTRCNDAAGADRLTATRWGYALLGRVATDALLCAAISYKASAQAQEQRYVEWAKSNFEDSLRSALTERPAERFLSEGMDPGVLAQAYTKAIGDLEQSLPGEDHELDTLLHRRLPEPPGRRVTPPQNEEPDSPPSAPAKPRDTAAGVDDIAQFVVQWLSSELKLPAGRIDTGGSFFDYGLDSVTAVMLAAALEDNLDISLPAEIAYDFPVIRVFCAEVTRRVRAGKPAVSGPLPE